MDSRPVRCIVKLGGSAITVKDKLETIDERRLSAAASDIRECMEILRDNTMNMDWSRMNHPSDWVPPKVSRFHLPDLPAFIVVHGAGSFGHFQASASGVNKGGLGIPLVNAGFVATRISVTKLNQAVVQKFAAEGIPAVSMSPFSAGWITHKGMVKTENSSEVRRAVDAGFVPVLHGDAVFDSFQGCSILSGDTIIRCLAKEIHPNYVVFLTNVQGVFDRPPSEPGAVLLKEIVVTDNGQWVVSDPIMKNDDGPVMSISPHDTTGGMASKIGEAALIAVMGIDVYIVEAGTTYALHALSGCVGSCNENWVGTIVRHSSSSK